MSIRPIDRVARYWERSNRENVPRQGGQLNQAEESFPNNLGNCLVNNHLGNGRDSRIRISLAPKSQTMRYQIVKKLGYRVVQQSRSKFAPLVSNGIDEICTIVNERKVYRCEKFLSF